MNSLVLGDIQADKHLSRSRAGNSESHYSLLLMNSAVQRSDNPNVSRLFQMIYCDNKKVNASIIDIE